MFLGSLLIATVLIGFGCYLHWNETQGWHHENEEATAFLAESERSEIDQHYFAARARSRRRIHALIIGCGCVIAIAAVVGEGVFWMGAWMSVVVALGVIVALSGLDAIRTIRYQRGGNDLDN